MALPQKKIIYLDYAAATPLDSRVAKFMSKTAQEIWANPSSIHQAGRRAKEFLEGARKRAAGVLKVKTAEIVFTSSGTEANNLAILGVAKAYQSSGRHLITTETEHHSVLRTFQSLESAGWAVDYLKVNKDGLINLESLGQALRPETILISIALANNEIGVIQPLSGVAKIAREWRKKLGHAWPFLHADACQAIGLINTSPASAGADLLTINCSKIYGPRGSGLLYKRNEIRLNSLWHGGSQEQGWRPGTENLPAIGGLVLALEIAERNREKESKRLTILRDWLIKAILKNFPRAKLNGHPLHRLPSNINISFPGIDGERLVLALSRQGVMVSSGAACTTGEAGPSHVLKAVGNPEGWGNLRITLGRQTNLRELNQAVDILKKEVVRLRSM